LPKGGSSNFQARITGKEASMKKSVVILLFLALFAAMAMPVAGFGPGQAQACGTDKGPPPPG